MAFQRKGPFRQMLKRGRRCHIAGNGDSGVADFGGGRDQIALIVVRQHDAIAAPRGFPRQPRADAESGGVTGNRPLHPDKPLLSGGCVG